MIQKIQVDDTRQIRFMIENEKYWFVVKDICAIIGNNVNSIRKAISELCFIQRKITDSKNRKFPMYLVNSDGICEIYHRTRSPNLPILMEGLSHFIQEPNQIVYACKEVSWLRIIQQTFKNLHTELQYKVDNYEIDLYFPDLLLAVECDENGHGDRSLITENERQDFISNKLKCQFIRFNPDVPHFNIGDILNKIFTIFCTRQRVSLKNINKPLPKSNRTFRPITSVSTKPCYQCKVVKSFDNFHKAKENRDGKKNICKDCIVLRVEKKRESLPENYTEKQCCICKETKTIENFYRDKQKVDGYSLRCKKCHKERSLELQEKPKKQIIEKTCTSCSITKTISEYNKRKISPDGFAIYCKSCTKVKSKKYYESNKEQCLENKRRWRKNLI